jgi:hypothetical protein
MKYCYSSRELVKCVYAHCHATAIFTEKFLTKKVEMDDMQDRVYGIFFFQLCTEYIETLTFAQSSNLDIEEHFYQDICMLIVYEENDCLSLQQWLMNAYGNVNSIY